MRASFLLVLASWGCTGALSAEKAAGEDAEHSFEIVGDCPNMVIFDFQSRDEDGKLGRWIAANLRAKLDRQKLFIMIEDIDREAACNSAGFRPTSETPADEVVKFAKDNLDADYAIWGDVEGSNETGITISLKCARNDNGKAVVLIDKTGERALKTRDQYTVRFVAWDLIDLMLKPYGKRVERPTDVAPPDPAAERRWKEAPNLLPDRGFELGTKHPIGWEEFNCPAGWQHGAVTWCPKAPAGGSGKCIKFEFGEDIAGTYGVAYYSNYIDIREWATYRFSVRVLSMGPSVKVFCKGYDWFGAGGFEKKGQWREVYRRQINIAAGGSWTTREETFVPKPDALGKYHPKKLKIGLYAYWPAGTVYFDDVVLKEIKDPPAKPPEHKIPKW